MIISEVQHIIDALEQALPKSFIFVLDTTDRTFMYKSIDRKDYTEKIVRLDQQHGIDNLTSGSNYYTCEDDDNTLMLKKLSSHSFIGICLSHKGYNLQLLDLAKNILMN